MIAPNTILQNRYLVIEQIGVGGMGAVYVATDQRFGSTVALKETFFTDPSLRKAFEREARLLNRLRHHALPRVSDHFMEEDGQFLVMEFIPGEDLSEMLKARQSAFPVREVLAWADQLLDALDYLHTQDTPVIHRDIKPQNLKLTARQQIVLLDFGLAKGTPVQVSRVTTAAAGSSVFGYSLNYAPIEQMQGTGTDPRSDLYSLGATLYHLLTGTAPPDALTRATAVLNGQPDPLRPADEVHQQVPASVSAVLKRALAQSAAQRPQTAEEMREELRAAGREIPREATRAAVIPQAATVVDTSEQQTRLLHARTSAAAPSADAHTSPQLAADAAATEPLGAAGRTSPATDGNPLEPPRDSRAQDRDEASVVTRVRAAQTAVAAAPRSRSGRMLGLAAGILALVSLAVVYAFTLGGSQSPASNQHTLPTQATTDATPQPSASPAPSPVETAPAAPSENAPVVAATPAAKPPADRSPNRSASRAAQRGGGQPRAPAPPTVPSTTYQWGNFEAEAAAEARRESDRARREAQRQAAEALREASLARENTRRELQRQTQEEKRRRARERLLQLQRRRRAGTNPPPP
jgi:serine/threonine protein kinase